jgi:phosphoribosylanthranilate isomerase
MRLDVKICGLSTPEAVEAAIAGGASHVGFIFFPKSPRNVSLETAAELARAAAGRVQRVAVTVDADDAELDRIVEEVRPDMLQLHGQETPERVRAVKVRFGLPVMKAFAVRAPEDIKRIAPYRGVADRFLFDAKAPAGSALPGGNGVPFDWRLLAALDADVEYMLSGGLDAGNVARALAETRPAGIDISSGVETAPGVKDIRLISEFLETVKSATAASAAS